MSTSDKAPGVDAAARLPLSLQQEFLRRFDRGDEWGPFGPRLLIAGGWRVGGPIDVGALELALADVVDRHESLRTAVLRDEEGPAQRILATAPWPCLTIRELSDVDSGSRALRAEELVNEVEAQALPVHELPLLRALLGRFDRDDAVLVLSAHRSAADAWSLRVIARDLAECYAARVAGSVPVLEPVAQYREFVQAQHNWLRSTAARAARDYWRNNLVGAQLLTMPVDLVPLRDPPRTAWHRFAMRPGTHSGVLRLAEATRGSPFTVLLAVFNLHAHRDTGLLDIVVPAFAPGRGLTRFERTVGPFCNLLPLRTDLLGCRTFGDVVGRTRAACAGAFANELASLLVLREAPQLMGPATIPGVRPCLFQAAQTSSATRGTRIGGLEYSAISRRVISQGTGPEIPDGLLWSIDAGPSGDLIGALGFSAHLFEQATVEHSAGRYRALLEELVADPDALSRDVM